jgi:hypothetical protein
MTLHYITRQRTSCGALHSIQIHENDALIYDTAASDDPADTLDTLLRLARDYVRGCRDHDIPPDHAILSAYIDSLS